MKATVVLTIAAFFLLTLGSRLSGQTIANIDQAKIKVNNSSTITGKLEIGEIAAYSRKATIQIWIDGKPFRSEDILAVKPGQKLLIEAEMVGGRRDYCKFPDTDTDLVGISEIISRGENGIVYQKDGVKAEWKLIKEESQFAGDKYLQVKTTTNVPTAEITVSNDKFSQTSLKIAVKTNWLFTQNGETLQEENIAEETIYLKLAGESNAWFLTKNLQATGIKNQLVQEKLEEIQSAFDSIETNFYRLNFASIQQSNRNLQNMVGSLKSTIDMVIAGNPSYQAKVIFIGLPSDNPYNDISVFSVIKNNWDILETILNDQKEQLRKLSVQPTKESTKELSRIIAGFINWQQNLPENATKVLSRYIPDFNTEKIQIPENIYSIANEKMEMDYSQTIIEFSAFLDQRIQQIPVEIQKIRSIQARLQAVKLFDGMLRSYISSIYWVEWKNTRETELLTLSLKDNL